MVETGYAGFGEGWIVQQGQIESVAVNSIEGYGLLEI